MPVGGSLIPEDERALYCIVLQTETTVYDVEAWKVRIVRHVRIVAKKFHGGYRKAQAGQKAFYQWIFDQTKEIESTEFTSRNTKVLRSAEREEIVRFEEERDEFTYDVDDQTGNDHKEKSSTNFDPDSPQPLPADITYHPSAFISTRAQQGTTGVPLSGILNLAIHEERRQFHSVTDLHLESRSRRRK